MLQIGYPMYPLLKRISIIISSLALLVYPARKVLRFPAIYCCSYVFQVWHSDQFLITVILIQLTRHIVTSRKHLLLYFVSCSTQHKLSWNNPIQTLCWVKFLLQKYCFWVVGKGSAQKKIFYQWKFFGLKQIFHVQIGCGSKKHVRDKMILSPQKLLWNKKM